MTGTTQKLALAAATTLALLAATPAVVAQEGFAEIATDFEGTDPAGVVLPSICIGSFDVPKAMYTIEPAAPGDTRVTVLTNPPDLVETGYDAAERLVYFKFNLTVAEAEETNQAGIIVRFPPNQLRSVDACCSQSIAIRDGFTSLETVTVSTKAEVDLFLGVQQDTNLALGAFSGASIRVKTTDVAGPKATTVDAVARGAASVSVAGDVTTLSCNDRSTCLVGGSILDPTGSKAIGASSVEAASCEGVTVATESNCLSTIPAVAVAPLGLLPLVLADATTEDCVNGGDLFRLGRPWMNTEAPVPTISPAPTPTTAAPVVVAPVAVELPPTNAPVAFAPVAPPPVVATLAPTAAGATAATRAWTALAACGAVTAAALMLAH
eukprot:jgi/Psemu1/285987/fgenesh1_pg.112_\